jgi:hypothetical protein
VLLRPLIVVCAVLVAACSQGSGLNLGVHGPPSARSVAESSSGFSGVQRCPESGSYDKYLQTEQTKAADTYAADKKTWDDLKAAGANDSYIAAYADNTADCDQFGSSNLQGKVAYVFAIRFKDSGKAAAAYTTSQSQFHLADSDVAQLKGFGATVQQGADTALGANSVVVKFDISGVTAYIALWQNKEFEVAMITYNLPLAEGPAAATKVNSRIR